MLPEAPIQHYSGVGEIRIGTLESRLVTVRLRRENRLYQVTATDNIPDGFWINIDMRLIKQWAGTVFLRLVYADMVTLLPMEDTEWRLRGTAV